MMHPLMKPGAVLMTAFLACNLAWTSSGEERGSPAPAALEALRSPTDLTEVAPGTLAREMIRRRETRFIGIAGFTVEVPGVQTDRCDVVRSAVYVLPGTSDYGGMMSDELRKDVFRVARGYNVIMKRHLAKRGGIESLMRCFPSPK
jgi:hypothetical protein